MIENEHQLVNTKLVKDIICDLCGESTYVDNGNDLGYRDFAAENICVTGVYGHAYDCLYVSFDACHKCLVQMYLSTRKFKDFWDMLFSIYPTENYQPTGFHYLWLETPLAALGNATPLHLLLYDNQQRVMEYLNNEQGKLRYATDAEF